VNSAPTQRTDELSVQLGTGTAFVLAGQAAFVLGGYLLHLYLARAIPPLAYGTYGLIMNILTWAETILNSGIPWAMRRHLASATRDAQQILAASLRWQLVVSVALLVLTLVAAPWFSTQLNDAAMTAPLQLAFLDILFMGLYTLYRGALNGLRLFAAQGLTMFAYTGVKLLASLFLVSLGGSLQGAIIGNTVSALAGALVALWLLRRATGFAWSALLGVDRFQHPAYDGRKILGFAAPTVLFTLSSTFLTTIGLVAVKARVADGVQVAYYSAANYLAMAPSVLLVAFSFTLFPHLARSVTMQDWAAARSLISTAVRYLALVLLPGIAVVISMSSGLVALLYPPSYAAAAPLLSLLIISTGLHSLFMVFANSILAEGRTGLALGISAGLVPLSMGASWYLAAARGPQGAATAAVVTTAVEVAVAGLYVTRRFRVRMPWPALARMALASIPLIIVPRLYLPSGLLLIPFLGALFLLYGLGLVILREIDGQEVAAWRAALLKWRVRTSG